MRILGIQHAVRNRRGHPEGAFGPSSFADLPMDTNGPAMLIGMMKVTAYVLVAFAQYRMIRRVASATPPDSSQAQRSHGATAPGDEDGLSLTGSMAR